MIPFLHILCVAAVGGVSALATLLLVQRGLTWHAAYPDFIAGQMAFTDLPKTQDLLCFPLALAVGSGVTWSIHHLLRRLEKEYESSSVDDLRMLFVAWSLPVIICTHHHAKVGGGMAVGFVLSIGAFLVLGISAHLVHRLKRPLHVGSMVAASLIPATGALSVPAMGLTGRLSVSGFSEAIVSYCLWGAFGAYALGLGLVLVAIARGQRAVRPLAAMLVGTQAVMALYYLTLLPPAMTSGDQVLGYGNGGGLLALAVALIAVSLLDLGRRAYRLAEGDSPVSVLSPPVVLALVFALRQGITEAPHLPDDDYHFGEQLLGIWRMLGAGELPYVDQVPPHGMIDDDLATLLAYIFYDGKAMSVVEAARTAHLWVGGVAFAAVCLTTRSLLFAGVSGLLLNGRPSVFVLSALLCVFLGMAQQARPLRWLGALVLAAPVVILGVPAQGLVLLAALSPLALVVVVRAFRADRGRALRFAISLTLACGALAFLTPLGSMIVGAIRYVRVNAAINQLGYGIPWVVSLNNSRGDHGISFEVMRSLWVLGPAAGILLAVKHRRQPVILWSAVAVSILCLLLTSYSMGRIDPGWLSRNGWMSSWVVVLLVPYLLSQVIERRQFPLVITAVALVAGGMLAPTAAVLAEADFVRLIAPIRGGVHVAAAPEGLLARTGRGAIASEHLKRLTSVFQRLEVYLSAKETYLDLTSRNAHYALFNRRPPIPITAMYNLVPRQQQRDAIARLERSRPRVALLSAKNVVHDGGPLSLRTHLMYRYVVERYTPFTDGPLVFGMRDLAPGIQPLALQDVTNKTWIRGVARDGCGIKLADPRLVPYVRAGDTMRFVDGTERTITRVFAAEARLECEGASLDAVRLAAPRLAELRMEAARQRMYVRETLDSVWAAQTLKKLPSAWGHSWKSLKRRAKSPRLLSGVKPVAHDLAQEHDTWAVTGKGPSLTLSVTPLKLRGKDADLLHLRFECLGRAQGRTSVVLQISYWVDEQKAAPKSQSFLVEAANGSLVVPLDAYPSWRLAQQLAGLRIDLHNAADCKALKVDDLTFYKRRE